MISPAEHFASLMGLLYKLGIIDLNYAVNASILMPTFVLQANIKYHQEHPEYWTNRHK
jgi:hypothetical protein